MMKFNKLGMLCLLSVAPLISCEREEDKIGDRTEGVMMFGIDKIVQPRIDYGDQSNGGISATFESDDRLGLYAFYNNFFYFYPEYNEFAESVVFVNQELVLDDAGNASYSPLRTWTFSTIYGIAPYMIDCFAYHPYNTHSVNIFNNNHDIPVFEYTYANGSSTNSNIDFMTAHTRHKSDSAEEFRATMLATDRIAFEFTRRTASFNFRVSKPANHKENIVVKKVEFHFDAYTKFLQQIDENSRCSWENMTTGYSLRASTTCNVSIEPTNPDITPDDGVDSGVKELLENDNLIFLPPDSKVLKIVFSIEEDNVPKTYTWHAHIEPIVANKHFSLNLELDPDRAN